MTKYDGMSVGMRMNDFIENVNDYMKVHNIKKSFLILATDFGRDKTYRILRGDTDPTYTDMQKIADAFNQEIDYFMSKYEKNKRGISLQGVNTAFFAGNPPVDKDEIEFTQNLIEVIEHYDALTRVKA